MAQTKTPRSDQPDDGTRALLRAGAGMLLAGVVAALLTAAVFGGISRQGPHTNAGWLSLMVALMCLPFGLMLFTLGAAKWFRNRRLARRLQHQQGDSAVR
jgi:uncharacterized membrane protein YidH (DUF202 family)